MRDTTDDDDNNNITSAMVAATKQNKTKAVAHAYLLFILLKLLFIQQGIYFSLRVSLLLLLLLFYFSFRYFICIFKHVVENVRLRVITLENDVCHTVQFY